MPKLFSIYTKIPFQFMRCRKSSHIHLIYYYAHERTRGKPNSFCNIKTARQNHA